MEEKRGRKPKYLTVERWNEFLTNHWVHLSADVCWLKRLVCGILFALISAIIVLLLKG